MNDIQESITAIDIHFQKNYPNIPHRERLLARCVKLSEEVGELSEAVLTDIGDQRKEKGGTDLGKEIADVMITTLMLAQIKHIDAWEEIRKKLKVVKSRYGITDV